MFGKSTLCKKRPKKLVAIVVPLSNRTEFTPEEEISLRHLIHYLGNYDKYFVINKNLSLNYPGFAIKRFAKKYFGSTEAHKKLLFSPIFYETFNDYKYILTYHLDSLIFSDQLKQWCELDLDFIGAPWIKHKDAPYAGRGLEGRVGNSGFSLKKVESFLKIIYSKRYCTDPVKYWEQSYANKNKYVQLMNYPKKLLKYLIVFNGVRREMTKFKHNEDPFWSLRGTYYYPEFQIASVETALRFAFECVPRYCFELTKHTLPFGCHAWHRYDREFWEPYLLKNK